MYIWSTLSSLPSALFVSCNVTGTVSLPISSAAYTTIFWYAIELSSVTVFSKLPSSPTVTSCISWFSAPIYTFAPLSLIPLTVTVSSKNPPLFGLLICNLGGSVSTVNIYSDNVPSFESFSPLKVIICVPSSNPSRFILCDIVFSETVPFISPPSKDHSPETFISDTRSMTALLLLTVSVPSILTAFCALSVTSAFLGSTIVTGDDSVSAETIWPPEDVFL